MAVDAYGPTSDAYAPTHVLPPRAHLGLVLQGPLRLEQQFTLETVRLYRRTFAGCPVVVSTWQGEDETTLALLEAEGATVLRNALPPSKGPGNANYQIASTQAGLAALKGLGCQYAIKTRTDQRLYETNVPEYLFSLLQSFPVDTQAKAQGQQQRLVALSINTFRYRYYDVSDFFLFGTLADVTAFWSCPLEERDSIGGPFESLHGFCKATPCEIYFTTRYLARLGHTCQFTLEDSWETYARYFCVIDADSVGFYWPKYSNAVRRWRSFFHPLPGHRELEELTFKEWLLLYHHLAQRQFAPQGWLLRKHSPAAPQPTLLCGLGPWGQQVLSHVETGAHALHTLKPETVCLPPLTPTTVEAVILEPQALLAPGASTQSITTAVEALLFALAEASIPVTVPVICLPSPCTSTPALWQALEPLCQRYPTLQLLPFSPPLCSAVLAYHLAGHKVVHLRPPLRPKTLGQRLRKPFLAVLPKPWRQALRQRYPFL